MSYKSSFVCLANSRKLTGRCIAGLELVGGSLRGWVRPVSRTENGELQSERFYAGYKDPKLLDVIEIEFLSERNPRLRPEDRFFQNARSWVRTGVFDRAGLTPFIEQVSGGLWADGDSTSNGLNDRIPADLARSLPTTLKLIQPTTLKMYVQTEGASFGKPKRKVRGQFRIGRFDYILAVTDPVVETEFRGLPEGTSKTVAAPILCLSVSEVFEKQDACYKLIAGVI